jgi:hypothetical protein
LQGSDGDAVEAQLGVVVVFDDEAVLAFGPFQQRGAAVAREHGAGGEMVGWGDDDCGCVCGFERVDVEPVAVGWDRRGAEAGLLDDQVGGCASRGLRRRRARFRRRAASGR